MKRPAPLIELEKTLARIFYDKDVARKLVENAGIEPGKINFDVASETRWRHIVNESLRQEEGLKDLVAEAIKDRPDAEPELQKPFGALNEWLERHEMSARELADKTNPLTFFEIALKLPLTKLERALTKLERTLAILATLALIIAIAMAIYWYTPSNTSNFSIRGPEGNDASAFVAKIHNDGGRSAEFVDGSFALEFTNLPIQTHTNIVLVDAENTRRIPGHDDDVHITLTTTTFLTPIAKQNGGNCFPTEEEVKELLPDGRVVLTAKVEESGHREKTVRTRPVSASFIQPFILRAYPDDVPRLCR